jgi:hypothetical protein
MSDSSALTPVTTITANIPSAKYYDKCRTELIRIMFKLHAKNMASHPIFNAVLTKRLLELWNIPNVRIQTGYLHDSKLLNHLVPYVWVFSTSENGDDIVTDLTFYPKNNKPIRVLGTEIDFNFVKSLEEYVTIKDSAEEAAKGKNKSGSDKEENFFRYITIVPHGYQVLSKDQASLEQITRTVKHESRFIDNCPKSYRDMYKEITDTHTSPSDLDEKIEVKISSDNLNGFIKSSQ